MRYMMLVTSEGNAGPAPHGFNEAMAKLHEGAVKSGQMIAGGALGAPASGARVRLASGKVSVIDGPFTEAKEWIGGFAILEFKTKEEALEATVQFMELHNKHWPGWQGDTEMRQILGPEDAAPPK
jgi:hypothetical protein